MLMFKYDDNISNKFMLSEFIIKLQLHFLNDIFIKLIVSDIWPKN